jgi:hypothetical protein
MADQGAKKPEYLFNGSKFATAEECIAAITAAKANAHSKTAYWKLSSRRQLVQLKGVTVACQGGSRRLAAGVSWCS